MAAGVATFGCRWQASRTVRHFGLAVGFALAAVAVGFVLYAAEKYWLCPERRFIENPAAVMMRACGLAHFWIGWLFLFTSPALRHRRSLLRLLALTGLGAALCFLCAAWGASQNPFIFLFFYGFFLVHEIRDETTLYRRRGDGPPGECGRLFLRAFSLAAAVVLCGLLTASYLLYTATIKPSPLLQDLGLGWYVAIAICLCGISAHACRAMYRAARHEYGSLRAALSHHTPLVAVYFGIFAVLLLGLVAGSVSFNLIILIHAGTWLVFIYDRLSRQPPPARRNLWTWVRYTPAGFLTLHLVVIGLILLVTALRVYAWQRVGLASALFAGPNFPYWSLMHIAMSFWRPR